MFRNRAVSLPLVALFVWVAGCYNFTPIEPGEAGYYGKIRVWTMDGERAVIHDPQVQADSIKGSDSQAIALSEVATVEAASMDVPRTMDAVLAGLGVVALAVFFAMCPGLDCD